MVSMKTAIISDQVSMDFEEALGIVRNRFEYVEIHALWNKTVEDLNDEEAREVERLLRTYGMRVSCLSSTLFLMCPLFTEVRTLERFSDRFPVFIGDVRGHMERLKRCIELCDRFGTNRIRVFPFRTERGIDRDFDSLIGDMGEIFIDAAALAGGEGKVLLLENCPHSYLPKGLMTHALSKRLDSAHFMLLYDCGNSFRSCTSVCPDRYRAVSILDEYEAIKDRVQYFHFKDYRMTGSGFEHVAFGEGDVGFTELYRRVESDGGNKTVSLEPEVGAGELERSIRNFIGMSRV
jgi:sugar phosphate isomerase/epimerase